MSIAKHILMTICAGTVLWLMMLVGGLVWAMLSTPGRQQHTDALWGAVYFETDPRRTDHDAIRIGQPAIRLMLLLACLAVCAVVGLIVRVSIKGMHDIHELVHACLLSWRNPDMRVSISTGLVT